VLAYLGGVRFRGVFLVAVAAAAAGVVVDSGIDGHTICRLLAGFRTYALRILYSIVWLRAIGAIEDPVNG